MDKQLRQKLSLRNPWHFLALGFGSGLSGFMPGTMGSVAGLPFVFVASYFNYWVLAVVALLFSLAGIAICSRTARDMDVHDHGSIVWDEIAGIAITFLWLPFSWQMAAIGFVLFRFFDILKPWPIGFIDKHVSGGLGIMLDDVIAGLMSCVTLHLLQYSFHIISIA